MCNNACVKRNLKVLTQGYATVITQAVVVWHYAVLCCDVTRTQFTTLYYVQRCQSGACYDTTRAEYSTVVRPFI